MSDPRLRSLQRQAKAYPDDVGMKATILRERVRLGDVDPARIPVAAYCGDPAALALDGGPYTDHCYRCERSGIRYEGTDDVGALRCGMCLPLAAILGHLEDRFGRTVVVRAVLVVGRIVLPGWCDSTRLSGRVGLHARRGAREGQCGRCSATGLGLPGEVVDLVEAWLEDPVEGNPAWWEIHRVHNRRLLDLAQAVSGPVIRTDFVGTERINRTALVSLANSQEPGVLTGGATNEAIRADLIAWALGTP